MYIKSVTLKNFKKFRDKTIKFNPGMTLLVGGNNEGKSTMLHALAVWEFCKNFLLINKGIKALQQDNHIAGVGMNIDDFTPINIPELKYLWTNLKPAGGYNLSIKCEWDICNKNKFLGIGLALANDRLFVKTISSNASFILSIDKSFSAKFKIASSNILTSKAASTFSFFSSVV